MATSIIDQLTAAIAADTARPTVKTIPADVFATATSVAVPATPAKTKKPASKKSATVAAPTSAPTVETVTVDGCTLEFKAGAVDIATVKAAILRETKNPWFVVACLLADQKCAVLKITTEKSPLAKIRAAITRGDTIIRDAKLRNMSVPANVKNFSKLGIAKHASEKNVWQFVKMP